MGYKEVIRAIHTQREVELHKDTNTHCPREIAVTRETMEDSERTEDYHNSILGADVLHFWKDVHEISSLLREQVNTIFKGFS